MRSGSRSLLSSGGAIHHQYRRYAISKSSNDNPMCLICFLHYSTSAALWSCINPVCAMRPDHTQSGIQVNHTHLGSFMPSSRLRQWLVYTIALLRAILPKIIARNLLNIPLAKVKYLSTQRSRMLLGAFEMKLW